MIEKQKKHDRKENEKNRMTIMVEKRMVERQKNKNSKTKEEGKDGKKNGMTKEQWNDKRRMRERRMKQQKKNDGNTKGE